MRPWLRLLRLCLTRPDAYPPIPGVAAISLQWPRFRGIFSAYARYRCGGGVFGVCAGGGGMPTRRSGESPNFHCNGRVLGVFFRPMQGIAGGAAVEAVPSPPPQTGHYDKAALLGSWDRRSHLCGDEWE